MFLCPQQLLVMSCDKSIRLTQLHSRVHWLDQYNTSLVAQLDEATAWAGQVFPLEARNHELELKLTRANSERDA